MELLDCVYAQNIGKSIILQNNKWLYYELYSAQRDKLNKSADNQCKEEMK